MSFITTAMCIRLEEYFLVTFCRAALGGALSRNSTRRKLRSSGRKILYLNVPH